MSVGTVNVPTAGSRVQVVTDGSYVRGVMLRGRPSNVGYVYVGDSGVSASSGVQLGPGDSMWITFFEGEDLDRWWVDAANNNDKVDYVGVSS